MTELLAARLRPIRWAPASAVLLLCVAVGILAGFDPRLAVFAALGMAFVLLTLTDLAAGVVILIVVVFAETTPLAGPAISFTKLTGLLLAVAWLARLTTQAAGSERLILTAHPIFSYLLALYLGWIAITTSWAGDQALALTQGSRLLLVALLYVIVYTAIGSRRQAIWVIAGFATGAAVTAAYGLVLRPEVDTADSGRLVSTVQDPNFLARALVAGLALTVGGVVAARGRPSLRLAAGAGAAVCLTAFFLTGSRGGLVALAAALVASVVVAGRWRAAVLLLVAAISAGAIAYYTVYAPPEIRDRVVRASQGETRAEEGRLTIWLVGWRMFQDNPVRGVGAGQFRRESIHYVIEPGTAFRTDRVVDRPGVAHNTYLGIAAELGVVGLALYLGIVGFSVGCGLAAARRFARDGDWRMEVMTRALLVALAGVLTADFFVSAETSKITWLLLSLGPALLAVASSADQPEPDRRA